MIEPLQGFGFKESNYERPGHNWECGWASQGEPCHIGPDGKGICQAHRECIPYIDGDRYHCARPRNFGGDCQQGPLPDGLCSQRMIECQPVRTLRARRKLVTFTVTALALGTCLLMFGGPWWKSFISPGELTLQHHSKHQNCADCHSAAASDRGFEHWVSGALHPEMSSGDMGLCLECHDNLGPLPKHAHGLAQKKLDAIGKRNRQNGDASGEPLLLSLIDAMAGNPQDNAGGLACVLCHHEHRGRDHDLTRMTNAQCQRCHTVKFNSFHDGHPEFAGFPYKRRTRLHFDHATHYLAHFADFRRIKPGAEPPKELMASINGGAPFDQQSCYACHRPDATGKTMPIRGFQQSCASCHGPEIGNDSLPGIAFFAIPPPNVAGLARKEIKVGQWPSVVSDVSAASLDAAGPPPFMELLLDADPELAEVSDLIRAGGWAALSQQEPAVVERYLWGIKQLIFDLVDGGRPALLERLEDALSSHADQSELAVLSGMVSADPTFIDALSGAQRQWFPDLAEEIEQYERGDPIESKAVDVSAAARVPAAASGWYARVESGIIRYRVTGHADRLVRVWLDVMSRVPHIVKGNGQTASDGQPAGAALVDLFGLLADPTASYRCMGCHTADEQSDGQLQINWFGTRTNPDTQSFTKFSHSPHVTLLSREEDNCAKCHKPEPESKINFARSEFVRVRENWSINTDWETTHTSGFMRLSKQTCAECHQNRLAGDQCLKCHNYHIYR